jgi:hypothetical protein
MVDLRTCVNGQKLLTTHGKILTYVGKSVPEDYYDHRILYPDGGQGSRTHDGFVFRHNRQDTDENVIEILPLD